MASCRIFSAVVTEEEGLTVAVHPETQIVRLMSSCVTAGLTAPGVRPGAGSTTPAADTMSPVETPTGDGSMVGVDPGSAVAFVVAVGESLGSGRAVLPPVSCEATRAAGPLEPAATAIDPTRTTTPTTGPNLAQKYDFGCGIVRDLACRRCGAFAPFRMESPKNLATPDPRGRSGTHHGVDCAGRMSVVGFSTPRSTSTKTSSTTPSAKCTVGGTSHPMLGTTPRSAPPTADRAPE